MALGQDFDLKQMVLLNCSFGPQEIARINRCISSKYANFRIFHEAVNELEKIEAQRIALYVTDDDTILRVVPGIEKKEVA